MRAFRRDGDLRPDPDRSPVRHGLNRVEDQVLDHLHDLILVDVGGQRALAEIEEAARVRPSRREGRGVADQGTQIQDLCVRASALGECQQLRGEAFRVQAGVLRFLKQLQALVVRL